MDEPGNEPAFVRRARLQAEDEQRQIEQALAERLSVAGEVDGRDVITNSDPRRLAQMSLHLTNGTLTQAEIAAAQEEFRALRARGMAIEPFPGLEDPRWRHQTALPPAVAARVEAGSLETAE